MRHAASAESPPGPSPAQAAIDALTARVWTVDGRQTSLHAIGYTSVGIDEGWENCSGTGPNTGQRQHDADGFPLINLDKFPSMKALVDYGHSRSVLMGWYLNGCACGERKERFVNYEGDVQRLHEFGFDGVKFDGCGAATNMTRYAMLMNATGKAYATENCHWGSCGADAWHKNPDGSSCPTHNWCPMNWFRTSGDINNRVDSWFANLQTTTRFQNASDPLATQGCWSYPDMLEVGRILVDGKLDFGWNRAHFGAWCVVSSPLILGVDITDNATMASILPIISNAEAIAVNQAWAGHPGRLILEHQTGAPLPVQVWAKPQPGGRLAVYVVNPTPAQAQAPDPLSCFSEIPSASKQDNVCFGQYKTQFPSDSSPASCAAQCLGDAACTAFVWALPSEAGTHCRISHSCTTPSSYLAGFDGYVRDSTKPGCGTSPPSPAGPVNLTVPFSTLGLTGPSYAVRDIWAREPRADARGGLTFSVGAMDSAFVLLSPK